MAYNKSETVERMIINIRPNGQQDVLSTCLSKPCIGCGSMDHRLLEIKSQGRTRSGRIVYDYKCSRVQTDNLYTTSVRNLENKLYISFYLSTKKYTEYCGNNKDTMEQVIQELDHCIIGTSELVIKFKEILRHHMVKIRNNLTKQRELTSNLLSTPCAICARTEHAMLREKIVRGKGISLVYNCPIAYHQDWEQTYRDQPEDVYRVCPSKLAKVCNYYQMEVIKAYTDIVSNNHDFLMSRNLSGVQSEALRICEEMRPGFCITRCEGIGINQSRGEDNKDRSCSN